MCLMRKKRRPRGGGAALLERVLEEKCVRRAKARGALFEKFHPPPAGRPDRLLMMNGRVELVELKTPTGRVSKLQHKRHADYARAGIKVHIIRTVEEFDEALAAFVSAASGDPPLRD
jgi:hypothetical protein